MLKQVLRKVIKKRLLKEKKEILERVKEIDKLLAKIEEIDKLSK